MLQNANAIDVALGKNGVAFGSWVALNSPEICEIQTLSGLDFVIIDMEHSTLSFEAVANLIRAVQMGSAMPIVRVPDATRSGILKALDCGAAGIIVPNVETAAQMREIVSATRYAPQGTRGACPYTRSAGHGMHGWSESVRWARENITVIPLIETVTGVENFEDIIAVPGVGAVSIGQFDLSQSMGHEGRHDDAEVQSTRERLFAIAKAKGVEAMGVVFKGNPEVFADDVRKCQEAGVRILAVGSDREVIMAAYKEIGRQISLVRGQDK